MTVNHWVAGSSPARGAILKKPPHGGFFSAEICHTENKNRHANIVAMSNKSDEDDVQLFRQAMADVRRLKTNQRPLLPQRPKPIKRNAEIDEHPQADDRLSDAFEAYNDTDQTNDSFARPGVQKQVLKKLRLGKIPIEGELDLHGYRVEQARRTLVEFLNHCREHGLRCVRIIHGKGLSSSQQQPVLKGKTRHWLQQRDEVLAFCPAHRAGGGDGAVNVLLKRG